MLPRGYNIIIKSVNDALFWLAEGKMHIASFAGGELGLSSTSVGGCWGYLSEGVLEQLLAKNYMRRGSDNTYRLTLAGKRAAALL